MGLSFEMLKLEPNYFRKSASLPCNISIRDALIERLEESDPDEFDDDPASCECESYRRRPVHYLAGWTKAELY
jgi:hypothetical protein